MQISKKLIIPMAAVAIIGAGVYGAAQVSAASGTNDPRTSLVQKLADTFHVDKSKVQAVFDEHHTEMKAEHEKNYEARLDQAVKDGELTSAQKDAVLAQHKKLAAKLETVMKDTSIDTPAERKTALEKIHTEAQDWAKHNNIDAKWLMGPGKLHGGMSKGHMKHMHHDMDAPTASPSAN